MFPQTRRQFGFSFFFSFFAFTIASFVYILIYRAEIALSCRCSQFHRLVVCQVNRALECLKKNVDDEDDDDKAQGDKAWRWRRTKKKKAPGKTAFGINSCRSSSTVEITLAAVFVSLLKFLVEQIDSKFLPDYLCAIAAQFFPSFYAVARVLQMTRLFVCHAGVNGQTNNNILSICQVACAPCDIDRWRKIKSIDL